MATVLKNDVHNNVARIFYNGILNKTSRAYFFLGKTLPWDEGDVTPPNPNASREYERETRSSIIGLRYVSISDVTFAIDRVDWSAGTVYDMYDDRYSSGFPAPSGAQDIADATMFVLTTDFNIYKCISNNYNRPSTVQPTGTNETGYLEFSDGYIWKYMGTVDEVQRSKFLTPDYIPVTNSTSGFYQSGIDLSLIKESGGNSYIADNVSVVIQGDAPAETVARLGDVTIDVDTGEITGISVLDPGSGYTFATITITNSIPGLEHPVTGLVGNGAVWRAQIDQGDLVLSEVGASAVDGQLSFIYVNDVGSGYSVDNTTVTITGDGENASADAVIVNGEVVGISLNNHGSGYTFANATITDTGNGTGAIAEVIISPVGGHGKDLVKESFARTVGFQMTTADEINQGFLLESDYRQTGLIFDPDVYLTPGAQRSRLYSSYGSTCYRLDILDASLYAGIDISSFALDQKIYNQTTDEYLVIVAKEPYQIAEQDVGVSLLLQSIDGSEPEVGDIFQDENNTNLFSVSTDSITNPEVDKFSGSMVFINNRTPFRKNVEQIVNLRTFIEF